MPMPLASLLLAPPRTRAQYENVTVHGRSTVPACYGTTVVNCNASRKPKDNYAF